MQTTSRCAAVLSLAGALIAPALARGDAAQRAPTTFSREIAPLMAAHCSICHQPEGSASFSLITYADVKARAERIASATRRRYMPPWKPEPGVGEFVGVRRLSDEQIALIDRWIADGMFEGDPGSSAPAPPKIGAWRLGQPDLVLTMPAYTLRATGDDMYRHFVLPIPVAVRRYIKAWELRPGNPRVVHHATMEIDATGMSRHLDEQDPEPGYEGLIAHTSMAPDGYFLDWAPGHTPYVAPEGMSFPVDPNSDLVLMLHLRPSGRQEVVQASVGLYFSATPPTRIPALLRLTRQDIDIPAGEPRHVITTSYRLPVAVDVYTVQPHAHNLAKEIEGFATLPDGTTKRLLSIKDWDFNWQDVYRYTMPIALPAGASVTMRWTYDNSAGNPMNPNVPPRRVTFGQRTSDEMAELWFQVLPRNQTDRDILTRGLQSAQLFENIKGYEMMLRADSGNAALHNDVALLYARAGNLEQVAAHFAATVRITPDSAPAHYNFGTALVAQGKRDEARRAFQQAIDIDPRYANAHRSLGTVLYAEGKPDEAARSYRRAIELAPDDASAHHNFGVLLQTQGKLTEAIVQYQEAVRIDRNYVAAHYGLALSFAAAGKFEQAVTSAETALALAIAARDDRLAAQIRERLDAYRRRQPFQEVR